MKIDEDLLVQYMESFVGFGSYEADFWFVGMEQGGGENLAELGQRLEAWRSLGHGGVVDFQRYCGLLGPKHRRWHGPKARIQPTLGKMIRVVLAARGTEASAAAVKSYQSGRLARSGDETLVAELMPLPSRSVGDWIYGEATALPHLQSREAYRAALLPIRTALLRDSIDRHAPRAVVFLGWSYKDDWRTLIASPLEELDEPKPGLLFGHRGKTACVVCHHPTSFGVTNDYFAQIGAKLAI